MEYKHIIQVELVTQFPVRDGDFPQLIQQSLGPWCEKATAVELNIPLDTQGPTP